MGAATHGDVFLTPGSAKPAYVSGAGIFRMPAPERISAIRRNTIFPRRITNSARNRTKLPKRSCGTLRIKALPTPAKVLPSRKNIRTYAINRVQNAPVYPKNRTVSCMRRNDERTRVTGLRCPEAAARPLARKHYFNRTIHRQRNNLQPSDRAAAAAATKAGARCPSRTATAPFPEACCPVPITVRFFVRGIAGSRHPHEYTQYISLS